MSPALDWLGAQTQALHPLLRELHARGGKLRGKVRLEYGKGLAGFIGRRLAAHLGVRATAGEHEFEVRIHHAPDGLHWDRRFGDGPWLHSLFVPVGTWPDGYFIERIGAARMHLTVDVTDGAWHWRLLAMRWLGLPLPRLIRLAAWKRIEQGRYLFHAGFGLAGLGTLFFYQGLLDAEPDA